MDGAGPAPGTPADPGDPNDPHDPGDPNASLECEIVGYPCSYADVPLEIIEATLARTDEALDMLDGGTTTAEVGTWLEAQGDLAEVQHDEVVLRFRLEGGRAMWISGPDALPGPSPDDAHAHLPPTSGTSMASAGGPARRTPVPRRVSRSTATRRAWRSRSSAT